MTVILVSNRIVAFVRIARFLLRLVKNRPSANQQGVKVLGKRIPLSAWSSPICLQANVLLIFCFQFSAFKSFKTVQEL